jgi:hypothetical protein
MIFGANIIRMKLAFFFKWQMGWLCFAFIGGEPQISIKKLAAAAIRGGQ